MISLPARVALPSTFHLLMEPFNVVRFSYILLMSLCSLWSICDESVGFYPPGWPPRSCPVCSNRRKKTQKNNTRTQKLTRRVNQAARKVMPPFSWTSGVFGFSFIFVCVFLLFGGWWPETVFYRRLLRCMMMCAYQQSSAIGLPTTSPPPLPTRLLCLCSFVIHWLSSFVR